MLAFNFLSILSICFCFCVLETSEAESTTAGNHSLEKDDNNGNRSENSIDTLLFSFGMELMKQFAKKLKPEENVFVAPFNAHLAYSMIYLATDEGSRTYLNGLTKVSEVSTNISKIYEASGDKLKKIVNQSSDRNKIFPEVSISNGLFLREGIQISSLYVQFLKNYFGDRVDAINLDFRGHPKESTEAINLWISRSTKNRTSKFFTESLSNTTNAILTSTLYFKDKRNDSAPDSLTELIKFKSGQTELLVPMLQKVQELPYYNDTQLKFESIELPLVGEYALTLILPHLSQTIDNLTEHSHLMDFDKYEKQFRKTSIHYKIPKLNIASSEKSFCESLQPEELSRSARSSSTTPNATVLDNINLIYAVCIDAGIKIDGTTIESAMEYVRVKGGQLFSHPIEFIVDRPFIINMVHKPTRTLLVSGIVRKPVVN